MGGSILRMEEGALTYGEGGIALGEREEERQRGDGKIPRQGQGDRQGEGEHLGSGREDAE